MNKIVIFFMTMTSIVFAKPAINPLVYAPNIAQPTINGDLSDWADKSDWSTFGKWYERNGDPNNPSGLTSTTNACYAWNVDNDMLYIGIESTEGLGLILEVGGLMGDLSDMEATSIDSNQATQVEFKNWSAGVPGSIVNQFGGVTNGISAAYTWDGSTITIEIGVPIYSDWANVSTAMDLDTRMDVYIYANVFDAAQNFGDSQVADGEYLSLYDSVLLDSATLVRLLETSSPQTCDDIPDSFKNQTDLNTDCRVDFADMAILANLWSTCYELSDPNCLD